MSTRFGAGILIGTAAAAVVALIPALRVGIGAWIVLWGAMALVAAPLAGALRTLGLRSQTLASAGLAVVVAAPVLMVFARILKTSTHHRPLGAVTFALIAAMVLLGSLAASARLVQWAGTRGRRLALNALGALCLLAALRLAAPLLSAGMGMSVLDAVLIIAAGLAGALAPVPTSLDKRLIAVASSAFALAVGLALGATTALPGAREQAHAAPVAYGVIGALSR